MFSMTTISTNSKTRAAKQSASYASMASGASSRPTEKESQCRLQEVWSKVHKMFGLFQYKQGYSSLWKKVTVAEGVGEGVYFYQGLKDQYNLTDKGELWKCLQLQSCVIISGK